jgi:hypothetical protein
VIVRIATEDQYRVPDDDLKRLNELDNAVVEAVETGDERRFNELFAQMIELVRNDGIKVEEDFLHESDVILPPPDVTLEEAAKNFTGDGLIPET